MIHDKNVWKVYKMSATLVDDEMGRQTTDVMDH